MRTFQISSALQQPYEHDPIADLCWEAREILGGYMEEPCDLDDDQAPDSLAELDDDGPVVHETAEIPINRRQFVTLSNLPYVLGVDNELYPMTDPGHVALRAAPFPSGPTSRRFGKDPLDDQLVFRVPSLGTQAAIFHGWELNSRSEVRPEHTLQLKHIETLLRFARTNLRALMTNDIETYEASYLSQVPRRIGGEDLAQFLGSVLGDQL